MEGTKSLDLPFMIMLLATAGMFIYWIGIRLGVREIIYFFLGVGATVFFIVMFLYKPVYIANDLSELYPHVENYVGNRWGKPFKENGKTVVRISLIPPRYIVFAHGDYETPYVIETPWYDFLLGKLDRTLEEGKFGPFKWSRKILFVPLIPEYVNQVTLEVYRVEETDQDYIVDKVIGSETDYSMFHYLAQKSDYVFMAPATVEVTESGNKTIIFVDDPVLAKISVKKKKVSFRDIHTISSIISRLASAYYEILEERNTQLAELVHTMREIALKDVRTVGVLSELFRSAMRDVRLRETQKIAFESVLDRLTTTLMTAQDSELVKQAAAQLLMQFYNALLEIEAGERGGRLENIIEQLEEVIEKLRSIGGVNVERGKTERESAQASTKER